MTGTSSSAEVPRHIAIIMDGNGRWATARGRPRVYGHKKGADALRCTIEAARELGVSYLTLFGFSTENWKRPAEEVSELMRLLRFYLRSEVAELHRNGVRLRVIGDRARFAADIVELMEHAETLTRDNDALHLTVALNYGGRQEIVGAARRLVAEAEAGRLTAGDVDEAALRAGLFAPDLPEPDLLIRTSGEHRISNFLLWQCAYAEFMFIDRLWPDFGRDDLVQAIEMFHGRERRFGGLVEPQAPESSRRGS
jgi:undecaprenyl diphosphate synthase